MKCKSCPKTAVISGCCEGHFIEYFEKKVEEAIRKYKLFSAKDRLIVAVSGGKDSLTVLYILKKLGYTIEGLAIDEGIRGYRGETIKDLTRFSRAHDVKIRIVSFKEEFGTTLDRAVKRAKENPCHVCGVLRRFLLNKHSKGYDVIATGHNMDDETQAVLMNIFKAQPELSARLGPVTGLRISKRFTKRVKPLYFLKDREVRAYTVLRGLQANFTECRYSHESFRAAVQDELNDYETKHPGAKIGLISSFLEGLPNLKERFKTDQEAGFCNVCGSPSSLKTCSACRIIRNLN